MFNFNKWLFWWVLSNIVYIKHKGIIHIKLEIAADWYTKLFQGLAVADSMDQEVVELVIAWHSGWPNARLNELRYLLIVRSLHDDKT
jgi:hypothetical protein